MEFQGSAHLLTFGGNTVFHKAQFAARPERKMEQLPNWLADAVAAAGMTAYADDLSPKAGKDMGIDVISILEEPPLH